MLKSTTISALIGIGVLPNIIICVLLIYMAKVGHSPIVFYLGFLIPFISFFCYLIYFKHFRETQTSLKKAFYYTIKPSILISLVILVFMLFMIMLFGANDILDWILFYFFFLLIIVLPNFLFQILIFQIVKKNFKQND